MKWITPLGFLGLISLAVLLLIYLLKPNYQQKVVSSTHVWKLSLRYRKKRLPISRLRNLILFICQMLILTACAFMLAQPIIAANSLPENTEKILIIDSSASMQASKGADTRFDRAVDEVRETANNVLRGGGTVSVIIADSAPRFLVQRIGSESTGELNTALDGLKCANGGSNTDKAMELAEAVLAENPSAEVVLYTGTRYTDASGVTVVDVGEEGEWNAAVLDVTESVVDGAYTFTVKVASYGKDIRLRVALAVNDINDSEINEQDGISYPGTGQTLHLYEEVECVGDAVQTVVFDTKNLEGLGGDDNEFAVVYSYTSAHVVIEDVDDCIPGDNSFDLYGGKKQKMRVQYYSTDANLFFYGAIMTLRKNYEKRWDFEFKVVDNGQPATEGYDLYIFEHTMPEVLPTDGVSILVNPDKAPQGSDIVLGETVQREATLEPGLPSPITQVLKLDGIELNEYTQLQSYDGYEVLLHFAGDPVFLVRNEETAKTAVFTFRLGMSTLSVAPEFPLLVYNLFEYYLPATVGKNVFAVGEEINVNARGPVLTVAGPGVREDLDEFPAKLEFSQPGTYTLSQTLISDETVTDYIYVRIPAEQSNICRVEHVLEAPYAEKNDGLLDTDLMIWFAVALVALIVAEWVLQAREQF
ncbi:MAG: VWA domain-containing protein [Clostridia bacterium]|nr:VWA domain-containing protein [Clostridia bacterium]